ncbi:hypothetical protein A2U01_0031567, partial [Trifolium medium]|nr:hypothetical protein [Trifolium medium]
ILSNPKIGVLALRSIQGTGDFYYSPIAREKHLKLAISSSGMNAQRGQASNLQELPVLVRKLMGCPHCCPIPLPKRRQQQSSYRSGLATRGRDLKTCY